MFYPRRMIIPIDLEHSIPVTKNRVGEYNVCLSYIGAFLTTIAVGEIFILYNNKY